jgi:DNA polymerase III subunit delta'
MVDAAMIYSQLKINNKNWKTLLQAHSSKHLHHALLFYGPAGSGKSGHAIELAAFINCEQRENSGPCGHCPSCKKIKSFQHSNIKLIIPYPRKGNLDKKSPSIKALTDANLDLLRNQMAKMGRNPYFKMELPNANTILINSIRELRHEIYMSTPDKGSRIIFIFSAEMLCVPNHASANALLKILEEPPDNTYFILVTSKPDLLLDTIISRCQKMYFPSLKAGDVETYLTSDGVNSADARLISRLSNGNIHLAENYKSRVIELYDDVKTILNAVFTRNPQMWSKLHLKIRNLKQSSRIGLGYFFGLGIYAFRDMLMLAQTSEKDRVIFVENMGKYEKILLRFPDADWAECISLMEDAQAFIRANGYPPLVINSMLMEMGEVIQGKEIKRFSIID